jgi:hypothetical protein
MIEWIDWIGVIPLLGLTGNWRGYRMGGKAVGGVMAADMKGKFEAARAAGNMDKAKAMADKAAAAKPGATAAKKDDGEPRSASGAKVISDVLDRNKSAISGLSQQAIDKVKALSEKSTIKEMEEAISQLGNIDIKTFDMYGEKWDSVKGTAPPVWNEYFRTLTKVPGTKSAKDVDDLVSKTIQRAKSAGQHLQNPDLEVARASGKSAFASKDLKADPVGFYRTQGKFYETEFPLIAKRIGDIRKQQIAAEDAQRMATQGR